MQEYVSLISVSVVNELMEVVHNSDKSSEPPDTRHATWLVGVSTTMLIVVSWSPIRIIRKQPRCREALKEACERVMMVACWLMELRRCRQGLVGHGLLEGRKYWPHDSNTGLRG